MSVKQLANETDKKQTGKHNQAKKPAEESQKQDKREQKKQQREEKKRNRKPRRRIFPIWLRLIVVIILCAVALIVGSIVGYSIIGDGSAGDPMQD